MVWHKHKIKQNVELGTKKKYSLNSINPYSPNLIGNVSKTGNPKSLSAIIDQSTISLITIMVRYLLYSN